MDCKGRRNYFKDSGFNVLTLLSGCALAFFARGALDVNALLACNVADREASCDNTSLHVRFRREECMEGRIEILNTFAKEARTGEICCRMFGLGPEDSSQAVESR